jgi:GNAT superfamily N-acetyltransferase
LTKRVLRELLLLCSQRPEKIPDDELDSVAGGKMMFYIKEITFCDYISSFTLSIPPLGIYSVRHSLINEGLLLGAYFDGTPIGIAVAEFVEKPLLTYIFIEDSFRGQGIGTQLIDGVLNYAKSKKPTYIQANVILQNEFGKVVDHMLKKIGFEVLDTATIIRYANDEMCKKEWTLFMEKRGARICKTLKERGFITLSFAEASPNVFKTLRIAIGSEFPPNLDPFRYVNNINDRLVTEYSFITLKDDEPAAFVTVTTVDDKTLVFQHLSTTFKNQGNGAFLLPFAAFMEKFLTGDAYSKVSAVIYDRNDRMKRLVHSFIGQLAESIKTQNVYHIKLG